MPKQRVGMIFLTLVLSLAICLLAGYLAGYPALSKAPLGMVLDLRIEQYLGQDFQMIDTSGLSWYTDEIARPIFSPPLWVFSPAWMVSFLLMGLTLFLILQAGIRRSEVMLGLMLFVGQGILLFAWAYNFFNTHTVFFALMFAVALVATLLCAIIQISRFSVSGGMMLVPYLFWVLYLTYLTYGILTLNKINWGL